WVLAQQLRHPLADRAGPLTVDNANPRQVGKDRSVEGGYEAPVDLFDAQPTQVDLGAGLHLRRGPGARARPRLGLLLLRLVREHLQPGCGHLQPEPTGVDGRAAVAQLDHPAGRARRDDPDPAPHGRRLCLTHRPADHPGLGGALGLAPRRLFDPPPGAPRGFLQLFRARGGRLPHLPNRRLHLLPRLEQEVAGLLARPPLRIPLALADLVLPLLDPATQLDRLRPRRLGRGQCLGHRAFLLLQLPEELPDLPLALRQIRLRHFQQRVGEPEPPRDREAVAASRYALDQPIGRPELPRVELERRVHDPRLGARQHLELPQVRRGDGQRAPAREVDQDRPRQRAALRRVRPAPDLVDPDQRVLVRLLPDLPQVLQVRRERRQTRLDRLLVADVGEDVPEDREPAPLPDRRDDPRLRHRADQADRLEEHRLAARVGTGDQHG